MSNGNYPAAPSSWSLSPDVERLITVLPGNNDPSLEGATGVTFDSRLPRDCA
jgi:hypothetical protein